MKDLLGFSCVKPIKSVYKVLEEHEALDLLRDDLISIATKEIYSEGRSRRDVQKDIKSKERALETLSSRYARKGLNQEQVRQCIYSIGDNHAFLRTNRDPCDRMIAYLKQYFHSTNPQDSKSSLAIKTGKGGARLTHDHQKQYAYVLQSLTLWREILHGACLQFLRSGTLPIITPCRHVPPLDADRTGSPERERALPPARHRSGSQPRPSRTQDLTDDARDPQPCPTEYRLLGRLLRHPHGRSQRPERAHVYR